MNFELSLGMIGCFLLLLFDGVCFLWRQVGLDLDIVSQLSFLDYSSHFPTLSKALETVRMTAKVSKITQILSFLYQEYGLWILLLFIKLLNCSKLKQLMSNYLLNRRIKDGTSTNFMIHECDFRAETTGKVKQ